MGHPGAKYPWARRWHIAPMCLFVLDRVLLLLNLFDFDAGHGIYEVAKGVSGRGGPEPVTIRKEMASTYCGFEDDIISAASLYCLLRQLYGLLVALLCFFRARSRGLRGKRSGVSRLDLRAGTNSCDGQISRDRCCKARLE
jgi:hypothetical protein